MPVTGVSASSATPADLKTEGRAIGRFARGERTNPAPAQWHEACSPADAMDGARLGRLTSLLNARLPLGETALGALLVSEGLVDAPAALPEVMRLYRRSSLRSPFAIVRCGGTAIAVQHRMYRAATLACRVAIHMVRYWGVSSATAVAAKARVLLPASIPEPVTVDFVRRVLDALPRTRWLDGTSREWFSVTGVVSPLDPALRKIFLVSDRVLVSDLRDALAKALPPVRDLSAGVFRRYLEEIGGCVVAAGVVRRPALSRRRRPLTPREASVVRLFGAPDRELDVRVLRRRAKMARIPRTTVSRLLEQSPLLVASDTGRVRLVGDATVPVRA